ncbi:carboxypeptidase-like regulatory domain-containing protein [Abyssalbus ytuae]|uniref:Carboxypeptidase-like regulatory domain-containing protein n=1 Tax=Abyssalbus ytuae TaxID=2926907 RepID=A0A9E7A0X7_9FLAO|nr:carboxypeptidase-like regulatory domain-containing protein [Abyssalbus ytuae]UOB18937.1 carboxypeptidase-like regulatory domain-containing protein [Abyssalbus ytuae]
MKKLCFLIIITLLTFQTNFAQTWYAGLKSLQLKDSTRIYKPNTKLTHHLHYRPVDLDIWYPSNNKKGNRLAFGDIFKLFEQRAVNYQDNEDYTGITNELAQFYVAELGIGTDGEKLLNVKTNTYANLNPSPRKHPLILYMSGFNGMGFENFKVLEKLSQNGYIVVAIWSVGRYPGNMTNEMADMMEQVYDAEFAIRYLQEKDFLNADFNNIGIIGYSWGGLSSATFINRNKKVKAFVSFDGTETHYFGEDDENDQFLHEIHDSNLINPTAQNIQYLYLESGDKLDEFQPSKEYNYFKKLNSDKYYLRFKNSSHADFTCIPSILNASKSSVKIYDNIESTTLSFFEKSLQNKDIFTSLWKNLKTLSSTTQQPYDISSNTQVSMEISGLITDKKTNKPLPYVNIGILNRENGTVTNTQGKFILPLKEEWLNDTLRVSSIGYKPIDILMEKIKRKNDTLLIKLEEQIDELNEVVITAKGFKKKTLGNKTESGFISTGFSYDQLGAEMGIKINIRKNPTYVDAFNFNIPYNRLNTKSIFRVNFYNIKNNKPEENILKDNILVPIKPKQTGKITVDLKPYDIVLTNDVIVTLEWVDTEGETNKDEAIFFSMGLLNSGTLYKKSSQAKFRKHSSMGVGFNIDVRY